MKKMTCLLVLVSLLLISFASPVWSQYGEQGSWHGSFMLGYRVVDVDDGEEKFKEDINLDDGARLFNLDFDFAPGEDLRGFVDQVNFDMNNFGGDPFETFCLGVRKYGDYTFNYKRMKSDYFLPGESGGESTIEFSKFDFERVHDSASLDIRLSKAAKFNVGFDRYTKEGDSTVTMDIEHDEFEIQSPIDESLNEYRGGFEYAWKKVTVVLEERIRDFENAVDIFLPGFSLGEDQSPEDPTTLDFFFLNQPYDFLDFQHTARVMAHPTERLTIQASASIHDLEQDTDVSEESQGVGYQGNAYTTEMSGSGDIDRDVGLVDVDVSYLLTDRLVLMGCVQYKKLDQDGYVAFGSEQGDSEWQIETWSGEAGVEAHLLPELTLSGGVRHETRDVDSFWYYNDQLTEEEEETKHMGYFLTLGWRPLRDFRLMAGFEQNSYDDPYAMSSPTDRQMYRIRAQYGGGEGFSISGAYRLTCTENDDSDWQSDYQTLNVRAGYRMASFSASVGYSMVDIERDIDQRVDAEGTAIPLSIAYDADSDYFDGRLVWSFVERWKVGGDLRFYENDDDFAMDRKDFRAYVEHEMGQHYVAHLGYRFVEYDEDLNENDDYSADIVEMAIGYHW
ncbi:MAG: hypothetical protein SWQ30_01110 [Thermodesulfobacteriota bacterium]|nr:hypothetical protein [Thermodesulfobacteriota bacterium]